MRDIALALIHLRPNASWTVDGNTYEGIEWLDPEQTKPTKEEIEVKLDELEKSEALRLLREQRNRRLVNTDWWASSDLIMTEAQIAYRQALRDITEIYTSLDNVVWPEEPIND